jgi:hypothetical protein
MPFDVAGPYAYTFVIILIIFFSCSDQSEGCDTAMTAAPIFPRRENTQEKLRLVTPDW